DMSGPSLLCLTTPGMTIALSLLGNGPVIWTLPPVVAGDPLQCGGLQFDALANNIADGWACAAAEFYDGVGNHTVSAPIRICINRSGGACTDTSPMPNCKGTLSGGVVNNTPCTPERIGAERVYTSR